MTDTNSLLRQFDQEAAERYATDFVMRVGLPDQRHLDDPAPLFTDQGQPLADMLLKLQVGVAALLEISTEIDVMDAAAAAATKPLESAGTLFAALRVRDDRIVELEGKVLGLELELNGYRDASGPMV